MKISNPFRWKTKLKSIENTREGNSDYWKFYVTEFYFKK